MLDPPLDHKSRGFSFFRDYFGSQTDAVTCTGHLFVLRVSRALLALHPLKRKLLFVLRVSPALLTARAFTWVRVGTRNGQAQNLFPLGRTG